MSAEKRYEERQQEQVGNAGFTRYGENGRDETRKQRDGGEKLSRDTRAEVMDYRRQSTKVV